MMQGKRRNEKEKRRGGGVNVSQGVAWPHPSLQTQ